jgi:hypothetical protein
VPDGARYRRPGAGLRHRGVPYTLQPAKIKETAVAGGAEEKFLRPLHENRHANDAIMHGTYFLLQKGNA